MRGVYGQIIFHTGQHAEFGFHTDPFCMCRSYHRFGTRDIFFKTVV